MAKIKIYWKLFYIVYNHSLLEKRLGVAHQFRPGAEATATMPLLTGSRGALFGAPWVLQIAVAHQVMRHG
jgi:hypothetical protein